jgi:hypothetical protein
MKQTRAVPKGATPAVRVAVSTSSLAAGNCSRRPLLFCFFPLNCLYCEYSLCGQHLKERSLINIFFSGINVHLYFALIRVGNVPKTMCKGYYSHPFPSKFLSDLSNEMTIKFESNFTHRVSLLLL